MPLAESANTFQTFGPLHLAAIGGTVLLAAGLSLGARRWRRFSLAACWALALLLPLNELGVFFFVWATEGAARALTGFLPIHLCPMAAFLIAWTLVRRTQWTFEFAYYWALSGTLGGLITPNLAEGTTVGSYWYWQFFTSHGGTVAAVLFAVFGLGMRPRPGSVRRVFLCTIAYACFVGGVTWLLRFVPASQPANYMFLCESPVGASPFFFLSWPWYLAVLAAAALGLFSLLYLPLWILDRRAAA